ncbi:unnamed protein product [Mytilus edulis]|uniref:Endonuclease/exonuclease/phosphatase domain-containing protein n=1 Tax=Mytilus edulis TaxID=6550 RepID=A0A8S3UA13_MYTED|nr:unnamed protein product [Mytilus edulis]
MDILLLQEHWLFDHELYLLDEIHTQFCGKGKAVDSDSSTCDLFIRSHRGYGGVAVIWDRTIDQYVKPLDDGNNRIQCIELTIKKPVLIVSAYLPTKADNDKYDEYSECIDQLFELIQKYDTTHDVIIGGDFNEDISKTNNSRRARKLNKFIEECNMKIDLKGPTFINVKGVEVSEIDYFIYKVNILPCELTKKDPLESNIQSRIRWNKVDTKRYSDIINKQIPVLLEKLNTQEDSITNRVEETMEILSISAKKCCAQKSYGKNKLKLKIWNPQIKDSLHQNKTAYKIWKDEGRPNDPDHPSVRMKKETRRVFRSEIRKEENKRKHVERDRIITANTQDKRLFYQLIKKQRNNKNIFINDLHVANNKYEHEEVIEGWHEHFKTLAEPISNTTYDGKHQDLCEMDYKAIKTICDQVPPRSVSRSELLEAIKAINTGKSEDIFDLLSLYETSNQGCKIGHININAVACADDIAVLSDNPYDLQILINHALQYSQLHHYTLQPQKSVIIEVDNKTRKVTNHNCVFNLNNQEMPNVTSSSHLDSSSSWYVITKKLLYKYGFSDIFQFLDNPPSKYEWKKLVQKKMDSYWIQRITHDCRFYSSLIHLNCDAFLPRNCHPIIDLKNDNNPSKGALSIGIKLKMVTGTYMTQAKRASFTKYESPTCKLCDEDNEDIEHLLLKCKILENIRHPFLKQLDDFLIKETAISFYNIKTDSRLQLILDCSKINKHQADIILNKKIEQNCELISRKLCFALHSIRARTLNQQKEKKKVKLKI